MNPRDGLLVLLRHGQSEWNAKHLYTGRQNPPLTHQGTAEAMAAGRALHAAGFVFDQAYSSELDRARQTAKLILSELKNSTITLRIAAELNERDYGELTGLSPVEAYERWGKDRARGWVSAFDAAPPGGESLAELAARVLPFFRRDIWPAVRSGDRVLLVAHRHSLRMIVKDIEGLSEAETLRRHIPTATPLAYDWRGIPLGPPVGRPTRVNG